VPLRKQCRRSFTMEARHACLRACADGKNGQAPTRSRQDVWQGSCSAQAIEPEVSVSHQFACVVARLYTSGRRPRLVPALLFRVKRVRGLYAANSTPRGRTNVQKYPAAQHTSMVHMCGGLAGPTTSRRGPTWERSGDQLYWAPRDRDGSELTPRRLPRSHLSRGSSRGRTSVPCTQMNFNKGGLAPRRALGRVVHYRQGAEPAEPRIREESYARPRDVV